MLGLYWRNWSPLGEEVYPLERRWCKQELLEHTTDYSTTYCNYFYLFVTGETAPSHVPRPVLELSDFAEPASPRHHPSDMHSPGRKAHTCLPWLMKAKPSVLRQNILSWEKPALPRKTHALHQVL